MAFHVGQKVVCVRAHVNPVNTGGLTEGAVYTVRALGITASGKPGIRVNELVYSSGPGEIGENSLRPFKDAFLLASRFRPVVERKTDISIFTAMLNPSLEDLAGHILSEVVKIRTSFDYPPIPDRRFDWSAIDHDTYDGAEDSSCPIGHGATEQEAIADLMDQLEDTR